MILCLCDKCVYTTGCSCILQLLGGLALLFFVRRLKHRPIQPADIQTLVVTAEKESLRARSGLSDPRLMLGGKIQAHLKTIRKHAAASPCRRYAFFGPFISRHRDADIGQAIIAIFLLIHVQICGGAAEGRLG